jgi:NTP pyrophosphatase (non-canonical NTP hydrolase)
MDTNNRFDLIRAWAQERGIYDKGDVKTQFVKLGEEFGELAKAIIDEDKEGIEDSIGDMGVVLTNLAHLAGFNFEGCIDTAYDVIKNRKGKMVNGSFIKEEQVAKPYEPTGRAFKCINRAEILVICWAPQFTIGKVYNEIQYEYSCADGTMYLKSDSGDNFFVDIPAFELVEVIVPEINTFDANA